MQPAVEAFTRGGASGPVNIATSGVYQWWYSATCLPIIVKLDYIIQFRKES